ncbi:MAG: hypothetical protein AB1384_15050 [Actinomycetota bacterium]
MDEHMPPKAEAEHVESAQEPQSSEVPAPPAYPYYYPPPPSKSSIDTATLALILAAAGLIYWCPPFVLPGVALYLAGKAEKEIAAGMPVASNAATFIKVARVLAIIGIVITGLFITFYIVIIILGVVFD